MDPEKELEKPTSVVESSTQETNEPPAEPPVFKKPNLSRLLGMEDPEPPADPVVEETPPPPTEPEKPEPAPPPAKETPPEEPKVKVRKAPVEIPPPPAAPTPQQPATPAPKPEAPKLTLPADLTEDEREELEFLRYAEARNPAHKGKAEQFLRFREEARRKIDAFLQENPDDDPNDDPDYQRWVKRNRPDIGLTERRRLERSLIEDRLTREMENRLAKERQAFEAKTRELELRPKLEAEAKALTEGVENAVPEIIKQEFAEAADPEKAVEYFAADVQPIVEKASSEIREYMAISSGVTPFNPQNPAHREIERFIIEKAENLEREGGIKLMRGNKRFADPRVYNPQNPEHVAKYWTFTADDIKKMRVEQAKVDIKRRVASEKERLERGRQLYGDPAKPGNAGTKPKGEPAKPAPASAANPPTTRASRSPGVGPGSGEGGGSVFGRLLNVT